MLEQSFALHSKMFFSFSFVSSFKKIFSNSFKILGSSNLSQFIAFWKPKGSFVKFVVLKIEEQTISDSYKVTVDVEDSFNNLEDARKCKNAKDTLLEISPKDYDWCKTQYKVQQIFFKSFVQADKKTA